MIIHPTHKNFTFCPEASEQFSQLVNKSHYVLVNFSFKRTHAAQVTQTKKIDEKEYKVKYYKQK